MTMLDSFSQVELKKPFFICLVILMQRTSHCRHLSVNRVDTNSAISNAKMVTKTVGRNGQLTQNALICH